MCQDLIRETTCALVYKGYQNWNIWKISTINKHTLYCISSRKFSPVTETFNSSFFVGLCLWFDFTHHEPSISVKAFFVLCDARFPKFQLANGINIQSQSVTLCFDEQIWDPGIAYYSWRIKESMEGKIWFYRFQSKRISMPCIITTKHVISCSGSVRDELRCNRWIAFNDLLREKRHLLTRIESHKKDLKRPRTKRRKASESACPTNALGSIVSLLSLLKILFNNMFGVTYIPRNMLHWFDINKVTRL